MVTWQQWLCDTISVFLPTINKTETYLSLLRHYMLHLSVPLIRIQSPTLKGIVISLLNRNPGSHFCPGCSEQAQNWFWNISNQISPANKPWKIIAELSSMCTWENKFKNVVDFRRNLSIHPVVLPQYNYQKITVPPIRLLNIWQEISLRIYLNRLSVNSVKKNE